MSGTPDAQPHGLDTQRLIVESYDSGVAPKVKRLFSATDLRSTLQLLP